MTTDIISHSIDAPGKAEGMGTDPDPEVPAKARRRQFSARYKAEVLAAYDRLPKPERGAFLRREGLYSSNITEWRHQRDRGALQALAKPAGRPPADPRDREVAALDTRRSQSNPTDLSHDHLLGPSTRLSVHLPVQRVQGPDSAALWAEMRGNTLMTRLKLEP